MRSQMETLIPEGAGRIAAMFGERREAIREAFPDLARRRAFLRRVLVGPAAIAAEAGDMDAALDHLDSAIAAGWAAMGKVALIQAGGAPDLICLRAVRLLAEADLVIAAPAAEALLIHHGRRDAERLGPRAATAEFLAAAADSGKIAAVLGETIDAWLLDKLKSMDVAVEVIMAASAA
jgi:hypothetical protein